MVFVLQLQSLTLVDPGLESIKFAICFSYLYKRTYRFVGAARRRSNIKLMLHAEDVWWRIQLLCAIAVIFHMQLLKINLRQLGTQEIEGDWLDGGLVLFYYLSGNLSKISHWVVAPCAYFVKKTTGQFYLLLAPALLI